MNGDVVTIPVGGTFCEASIWSPDGPGPHPAVVLGCGLGGTRDMALDAYAERFVDAGMVALTFDYRGFGGSGGELRQVVHIGAQLDDWRAAVAHTRSLDEVDEDRVVLWGTSFSAGHVLEIARGDLAVAGVVSQNPFVDGIASSRTLPIATSLRVGWLGARDWLAARLGRERVRVPIFGAPGSVALETVPGSDLAVSELVPDGSPFRNEVAAGIALRLPWYRPGRLLRAITCPVMMIICGRDTIAPAPAAERAAARSPRTRVERLDCDHFGIYQGDAFEKSAALAVSFFRSHLVEDRRE